MDFKKSYEFEWDNGNSEKPKKHGLSLEETEEAFFDKNRVVFDDWKHSSEKEQRATLLGTTRKGLLLNVTFTARGEKIRVITSRRINKKEVDLYEKAA